MTPRQLVVSLVMAIGTAHAAEQSTWINVRTGAPLQPGVYGRIEVHGTPPPLISAHPVVAKPALGPVTGEPLYFYLPAGQVRKWAANCQRHGACERPVYFVRVADTPGRLGRWNAQAQALHHQAMLRPRAGTIH
jgi:hypothetical protein